VLPRAHVLTEENVRQTKEPPPNFRTVHVPIIPNLEELCARLHVPAQTERADLHPVLDNATNVTPVLAELTVTPLVIAPTDNVP